MQGNTYQSRLMVELLLLKSGHFQWIALKGHILSINSPGR